jgi:hypothetical protein
VIDWVQGFHPCVQSFDCRQGYKRISEQTIGSVLETKISFGVRSCDLPFSPGRNTSLSCIFTWPQAKHLGRNRQTMSPSHYYAHLHLPLVHILHFLECGELLYYSASTKIQTTLHNTMFSFCATTISSSQIGCRTSYLKRFSSPDDFR